MLSSNIAVRKAYYAALSTIEYDGAPIPVYWNQIPSTIAPGIYIAFSNIRNNDQSNKGASVTQTSVTVSIYTNAFKYNDGVAIESVANEVLNRIYNTPQFKLPLGTFFQVTQTRLSADITNNFSDNQNVYIDRILTFNHTIFQNVS
jgi:hypothetical protein